MTQPRRRLVRTTSPPAARALSDRQAQKMRLRLEAERKALARWMARLRRAFHAVEKIQLHVARLERGIARREERT